MRLTPDSEGWRVTHPSFPPEGYYDIKNVGKHTVVASDENNKTIVFPLDHMDKDWQLVSRNPEIRKIQKTK